MYGRRHDLVKLAKEAGLYLEDDLTGLGGRRFNLLDTKTRQRVLRHADIETTKACLQELIKAKNNSVAVR